MPGRNRPIGRGRIPFRRWKRRRPASWHDALSTSTTGVIAGKAWAPLNSPVAGVASLTLREILAGQVDALYLDREEVRVDRIVGDVAFQTSITTPISGSLLQLPPVVRWGLVVEEDPNLLDGSVTTPTAATSWYNLWSGTQLGETEWMFLSQPQMLESRTLDEGNTEVTFRWQSWEHVDIRVKRKLGKSDRLWLVASYGNGVEGGVADTNLTQLVYMASLLRAVLVA